MDEQLLDVNELVQLLNASRPTIYRMIRSGELRAIRLGRVLRVSREELERVLRENTVKPEPAPKRAPSPPVPCPGKGRMGEGDQG